jgi:hypothetical protein
MGAGTGRGGMGGRERERERDGKERTNIEREGEEKIKKIRIRQVFDIAMLSFPLAMKKIQKRVHAGEQKGWGGTGQGKQHVARKRWREGERERERERRSRMKSKTASRPVCCNNISQGAFVKASLVHMAAICHRL